MRHSRLRPEDLAARAGVDLGKVLDALDYHADFDGAEVARLARTLGLNEVGLAALSSGGYPLPPLGALPFCLYPLRMTHGIGVVNAYIVAECGSSRGLLFDVGAGDDQLEMVWPKRIKQIDALFLTHDEGEHTGGLCEVIERFAITCAHCPEGVSIACATPLGEGSVTEWGAFAVKAYSTPGHSSAHNCYAVTLKSGEIGPQLLVTGDLIFAGSVGCGFHNPEQLRKHARRMLQIVKKETVLAPGHGPLTTAENELRYNPFLG